MGMLTAQDKAWMNTVTTTVIQDWGTTVSISRLITNGLQQDTFASPHKTAVPAHMEPSAAELVMAQGAPVGNMYTFFTPLLTTPTEIQNSDLLTTAEGRKYIVTGIQRYHSHMSIVTTSYEQPLSA